VYEIIDHLPRNACVLDIGSRDGSFRAENYAFRTVRVDLNVPRRSNVLFVQADAVRLPFRSQTIDAIVLNHCVEHFVQLHPALREIGRVLKPGGAAFVSVPDARTLTDRIYRTVTRNAGGHVNLFRSSTELEKMLASYFGLPHIATRTLHSGLTFLNKENLTPAVRAQMRFAGFHEPVLAAVNATLRLLDRSFSTRLSVYGWAMYFGAFEEAVDVRPMVNVCLRCGEGRHFAEIPSHPRVGPKAITQTYRCPACGAKNIGIPD
jgi:SAM-dependent methyltransferase